MVPKSLKSLESLESNGGAFQIKTNCKIIKIKMSGHLNP